MSIEAGFISIGGNLNPAAADWDHQGLGLLAYGAANSIALWDPTDCKLRGVRLLLNGHTKAVNAVKFFPLGLKNTSILLSGSADCTVHIWRITNTTTLEASVVATLLEHSCPISCIATLPGSDIFFSGASDGTVRIWKLLLDPAFSVVSTQLVQTLNLSPKYFPLSIASAFLDEASIILAVAGTRSVIQMFICKDVTSTIENFELAATLTGHEGWIRSLGFTHETGHDDGDLLLASASQDKYIRLWRVHKGEELPAVSSALSDPALGVLGKSLSNKARRIESAKSKYSITFEALLLGHEDWIYTASWQHRSGKLQLLSTSEDNSLAVWESDPSSGVWICTTRLGEISAQKGSTTATGSAGGFWIGLWSPDGNSLVSLGRTGSWRMWTYSAEKDMWVQRVAITGHTKEVKGICWSRDGSYLLSTSSDQTTRLFAEWQHEGQSSWHEFSRPQIHGYDLNCIGSITNSQFVTGADEKLLRVFDEPRGVAEMLNNLCNIETAIGELPDAANIPVLGLSNKAIQAVNDDEPVENVEGDDGDVVDPASVLRRSTLDFDHPPFEDHLARHLLWPETEKLYGHGYEISALATSNHGSVLATACRASSIDHAVIRLYDTKEWLEIRPPLKAHSLTVTALHFSDDDRYLLSVGRDRQWVVWERNVDGSYVQKYNNHKAHTRMILGASWAPLEQATFLTAGRDKNVKVWQLGENEVQLKATISAESAVTAVQCNRSGLQDQLVFAYGTESGQIAVGEAPTSAIDKVQVKMVSDAIRPVRPVNQLAWRPGRKGVDTHQLAVAGDDNSVRIYKVKLHV